MRKVLYIAGPMRRRPGFNFPAFYDAEAELDLLGYDAVNPARIDAEGGFEWQGCTGYEDLELLGFDLAETLALDLATIARDCDGVLLLDGWEGSSGARAEAALAQALGRPLYRLRRWPSLRLVELDVTLRATIDREVVPC